MSNFSNKIKTTGRGRDSFGRKSNFEILIDFLEYPVVALLNYQLLKYFGK